MFAILFLLDFQFWHLDWMKVISLKISSQWIFKLTPSKFNQTLTNCHTHIFFFKSMSKRCSIFSWCLFGHWLAAKQQRPLLLIYLFLFLSFEVDSGAIHLSNIVHFNFLCFFSHLHNQMLCVLLQQKLIRYRVVQRLYLFVIYCIFHIDPKFNFVFKTQLRRNEKKEKNGTHQNWVKILDSDLQCKFV